MREYRRLFMAMWLFFCSETFCSRWGTRLDAQQRLQAVVGLKEKKVEGDGNCQFRSTSDQEFGTPLAPKHPHGLP